jgi:uncharacterized membrane protein YjgN (DUF898 family)
MKTLPIQFRGPAFVADAQSAESLPTRRQNEEGQPGPAVANATDQSTSPSETLAAPLRELSLEFRGDALEYFRIWIVNLCLTLLTLGIFSAWAKVRNKRYLYSHTLLDGTPFQYLGQPLPIFRGRLIALALFLIYFISRNLITSVLPFVIGAGLVLAPWVVVRSAAFNARYSAYRNMTLSFCGNYLGAAKALYWYGLIPILAAGSAFDWGGVPQLGDLAFAVFGFIFPWWWADIRRFLVGNTRFGGINGHLTLGGGQLWTIYFLGSLRLIIPVMVGTFSLGAAAHSPGPSLATVIPVAFALLIFLAGYCISHGYIQARSGNLVWNNTRLGTLRFESDLDRWDLALLYFVNTIAIVGTAGLMTPWAIVRTIKYRMSCTRVLPEDDLAVFEGSENDSVQAVGAEVGQIFDLDLSL